MGNEGELCVGRLGVRPPSQVIRRKALIEIIKSSFVLVILVLSAATISWSQTPVTDESNPPQIPEQSSTSQSHPAPAAPTESGKPEQTPPPPDHTDATPPH